MAYTVLDITTTVQDDLGDSSFSASRILRYANRAQAAIFDTHLFKFCEKSIVGALTINVYTYDQQTDHQSTVGGSLTDPIDDNRYIVLNEDNFLEHTVFFAQYPNPENETSGLPTYWTEFGDQVYFNCPADKAYIFKQRYYRNPVEMTATSDVPEVPATFRELIENYILFRSEKYRGNHDVAATYKQDYEDGLENMVIRYSGNSVAPTVRKQSRVRVDA